MKKISIRNFLLGGAILSVLLGCISEFTPQVSATTSLDLTVSGALSDYLKSRQILVGTSFDATYQKIYTIFQNTGMTILRAVDYQSLVCLGVLPSQSLLTQLQIDKMDIKTSFNKDFIQLENQITSLQEKYRLQQDTNIDVLNGVTYAEAQDQIKSDIDKIVSIHTGLIQAFEVGYKTKILKFITDYSQYLTQNKALVQTISAKVVKLQYIVNESNKMDAGINQIYKNLQIADIMNKVSLLQSSLQKVFLENINPYIDTQVKKFKVATLLSGALADLKMTTLQQYNQEKDAYFAKTFAPWYNYAQYTKTQQAIQGIKGDYYTANKLNCNKLLVSNSNVTEEKLFSDIANTLQNISSGIILSKGDTTLKNNFLSGIQSFFTTTTSKRIISFKTAAGKVVTETIKKTQTSAQSGSQQIPISGTVLPSQPSSPNQFVIPANFVFTKPFTSNQHHKDIGVLQQFLSNQGYYTGTIDALYSQATKDAVYAFQLAKGILKSTDRKDLQGYFGPATRAKVNALLK